MASSPTAASIRCTSTGKASLVTEQKAMRRKFGLIEIRLEAAPHGSNAEISYSFTALGPDGDRVVKEFTQEHFDEFMVTWETELNHFIATGERLIEN